MIEAPFSPEQVQALNETQCNIQGYGITSHPFTCANRTDGHHEFVGGDLGLLVATTAGWVCPFCAYTQGWAHAAMAEPLPSDVRDFWDGLAIQQGEDPGAILLNRLDTTIAEYERLHASRQMSADLDAAGRQAVQRLWDASAVMVQCLRRVKLAMQGVRRVGDQIEVDASWKGKHQGLPSSGQCVELLAQQAIVGNPMHPGAAINAWLDTGSIDPRLNPDMFDGELAHGYRVTHWRPLSEATLRAINRKATPLLHVYGQVNRTDDVWMVGNRTALASLRDAIDRALAEPAPATQAMVANNDLDYSLKIWVLDEGRIDHLAAQHLEDLGNEDIGNQTQWPWQMPGSLPKKESA